MRAKYCGLIVLMAVLIAPLPAQAIPELQLYIEGATYEGGTEETWVTTASSFKLWVIGDVSAKGTIYDVHLSGAVATAETGTITLTPTTAAGITDPSTPASPVPTTNSPSPDGAVPLFGNGNPLPTHGIFGPGTKFFEWALGNFSLTDSPIGDFTNAYPTTFPDTGQINAYQVTVTGFSTVHFDAYNSILANNGSKFIKAPFSHDAQGGGTVPEPTSLLLLGVGLAGLGLWRLKRTTSGQVMGSLRRVIFVAVLSVAVGLVFAPLLAHADIVWDFSIGTAGNLGASTIVNGVPGSEPITVTGWALNKTGTWYSEALYRRNDPTLPNDFGLGVCNTASGCATGSAREIDNLGSLQDVIRVDLSQVSERVNKALLASVDDSLNKNFAVFGSNLLIDNLHNSSIALADNGLTVFKVAQGGSLCGVNCTTPMDLTHGSFTYYYFTTGQGIYSTGTTGSDSYLLHKLTAPVPEPASSLLLGVGLAALGIWRPWFRRER